MNKDDYIPLTAVAVICVFLALSFLSNPMARSYVFGDSSSSLLSVSREDAVKNHYRDVCSALYNPLVYAPLLVTETHARASSVGASSSLYGEAGGSVKKMWINAYRNMPFFAPEAVVSHGSNGDVDLQKTLDTIRFLMETGIAEASSTRIIGHSEQDGYKDVYGQREMVRLLGEDARKMGIDVLFTVQNIDECSPVFPDVGVIDWDAVKLLVAYSRSDSYYQKAIRSISVMPRNPSEAHIVALQWEKWCTQASEVLLEESFDSEALDSLAQSYNNAAGVGRSVAEDIKSHSEEPNIRGWWETLRNASRDVDSAQLRLSKRYEGVSEATWAEVNAILTTVDG